MSSNLVVNGILWGAVEPLVAPVSYDSFVQMLLKGLKPEKERLHDDTAFMRKSFAFRAFREVSSPNLNNPIEAKWALLLPPRSRETEAIADALAPLVEHRHGQIIYTPTPFPSFPPRVWINNYYNRIDEDERPYYVLLAGFPNDIPFRLQYLLDLNAAVGRVCFKNLEDYNIYARKVVDFETREDASVDQRAVIFATEHERKMDNGATYYSRHYMTDKLVEMIDGKGISVSYLAGTQATLANLKKALTDHVRSPALVYTATHGLGVKGKDERTREELQGALVCQDYDGQRGVFSADCVPESPFLHGSVMFTFACYGAGTPKESDFYHWRIDPKLLACRPKKDFVSALPLRLLAHSQGPLAFFGHIDPSWVYSFADPRSIDDDKEMRYRLGPFRRAVDYVLQGYTVGFAVTRFSELYTTTNTDLLWTYEDEYRRDPTRRQNPKWTRELADTWMTRNDMQNYIIIGDPAVKAKMIE